nr:hypothetical protein BaRGS_015230 [Batillaria attramentaria]
MRIPEPFHDCCQDYEEYALDPGLAIEAEPQRVVVNRRLPLSLDCPVVSDEDNPEFADLAYEWKKDGNSVKSRSPRSRVHVYNNGTLHIRKVVHRKKEGRVVDDGGLYECFVTNNFGTVLAHRINVVVARVDKKFRREPEDQTVPLGGTAYFQCDIHAVPDDLLIVWHKDDAILSTDKSARYETLGRALVIRNVVTSDAGRYKCQVTNKAFFSNYATDVGPQWRISLEGTLTVLSLLESSNKSPVFLVKPQNVTEVMATESALFPCVVAGTVPTPSVVWIKNSESAPDKWEEVQSSSNVKVLPGGSLEIHRATVDDAGTYACSDSEGTIRSTGELRVLELPVIEESPQSRRYPLASVIHLECIVAGQPLPRIRWLKDGKEVREKPFRVEFFERALAIYHSNVEDSGYYQCLAENKGGWALSLARIIVEVREDAPAPPYNVTAEPLTSSSVLVSWKLVPPVGTSTYLAFTVHRHRTDGIGGEEVQVVVSNPSTILYGLEANTEYSVIVKAYTNLGASLSSKAALVHTYLTSFPQPSLTPVEKTAIALNWSDFHARHDHGRNIASYLIFYQASDSQETQQLEVDGNVDNYLLKGLEENQEYKIRMLVSYKVANPDSHEDPWPWSTVRTGASASNRIISDSGTERESDDAADETDEVNITANAASTSNPPPKLSAPFNLHAYPLKSDAISLQWNYLHKGVEGRLPVTHYVVQCQAISSLDTGPCTEPNINPFKVSSHSNNAVIRGLRPFTLYNISVSAHSGDTSGPQSQSIYVQTKEDVPSRPENLRARVLAEGAVRLQWQPPMSPNGRIQGHFILYNNHHQHPPTNDTDNHFLYDSWTEVYQQGNSTSAVVANLTQHMYIFQVKACTAAGSGEPSSLIVVHMGADTKSSGLLSDQHLGILGGAAIGLTSIIVTVIVIVVKQRQLSKQLERQAHLELGGQPQSLSGQERAADSVTGHSAGGPQV